MYQWRFKSRAAALLFCSPAPCLPPGARRAVNLQQNSPVSSFSLGLGRGVGEGRGVGGGGEGQAGWIEEEENRQEDNSDYLHNKGADLMSPHPSPAPHRFHLSAQRRLGFYTWFSDQNTIKCAIYKKRARGQPFVPSKEKL